MNIYIFELERFAKAASVGVWVAHDEMVHDEPSGATICECFIQPNANAKYIAAASPEIILALIAEFRALQAKIVELEEDAEELRNVALEKNL